MEKQEIWKPVVGYEGFYEVSDLGRFKSLNYRNTRKEGFLKPSPDYKGYLHVGLSKNGKQESCLVHIIVWQIFNGKIPDGKEIDHIDGNPSNNCLENLRCVPHKENCNNPVTIKRHKQAANKRAQDPEWQKNHAEAMQKLYQDPEWQKNHAETMQKLYQDPEWRRKQAEATRKACCKPVDQFTTDGQFVKRWPGAREAARELGIGSSHITKCCKGRKKTIGGFKWQYASKI